MQKISKELNKGWTLLELERNGKVLVTCRMPKKMHENLDQLVREGRFMNRSSAIRHIIQYYLDIQLGHEREDR